MKEYVGWVLDGAQLQEPLSPWSWALPPSLQVDVLSNSEGLCALLLTGVLWRFHHWLNLGNWWVSLTSSPSSLSGSHGGVVILKLPTESLVHLTASFPSWSSLWAHQDHFINTNSDLTIWQNMVHWRREWKTTPVDLLPEPHKQYEKAKRYDTRRWAPTVGRCPIHCWGRVQK